MRCVCVFCVLCDNMVISGKQLRTMLELLALHALMAAVAMVAISIEYENYSVGLNSAFCLV